MHAKDVYDEDRVEWSERIRVRNDIESNLKGAERELLNNIPKQLSEALKVANTHSLCDNVRDWLVHGRQIELVDYLSNAVFEEQFEKLSRFGKNLNVLGVNVEAEDSTNLNEADNGCKWVPATFSQIDGRRVYGGVALLPKLSAQGSKGFKGFQANARKTCSDDRGAAGSNGSGGRGGKKSGRKGKKKTSKEKKDGSKPTKREEILEKYGRGKGWPDKPKRVGNDYFGKPGTGTPFYDHC